MEKIVVKVEKLNGLMSFVFENKDGKYVCVDSNNDVNDYYESQFKELINGRFAYSLKVFGKSEYVKMQYENLPLIDAFKLYVSIFGSCDKYYLNGELIIEEDTVTLEEKLNKYLEYKG